MDPAAKENKPKKFMKIQSRWLMRLRLNQSPTQPTTHSPPPNRFSRCRTAWQLCPGRKAQSHYWAIVWKERKLKRNRLLKHPVPAAQPWSNKYFVREKKIIDSVELNLIVSLLICFGNFITLEKQGKLLEEIKESLCILNWEGTFLDCCFWLHSFILFKEKAKQMRLK